MPIYEYRCLKCSHQDEHLQKISEPPLKVCPSCGKPTYKKMLSAAGFQLKGSGWYATDFRNKGSKPAEKAETKADAKTEAKPETKTPETKTPETKTETKAAPKPAVTTD